MTPIQMDKYTPEWAKRAKHIDSKPDWIDFVPHELWELGDAFFPIPRGKKSNLWPFHKKEKRFSADDEILNAYLEAGAGYGIVCVGDLAVLDIDDLDYKDEILQRLPDTLHQVTGSRTGEHHFYYCPDLDSRILLYDKFAGEKIHIGELKCDTHEFVVGPKSIHPSGNRYGPLQGEEIVTVKEETIREALDEYIIEYDTRNEPDRQTWNRDTGDVSEFYGLSADDVLPWLEKEKRISHPVHGSSTGSNFMKNSSGDTFMCWRCTYGSGPGCGLSGAQFLAVEATDRNCDDVRANWDRDPTLHYEGWRRAYEQDLIGNDPHEIPYKVLKGYGMTRGIVDEDHEVTRANRWELINPLVYETTYFRRVR